MPTYNDNIKTYAPKNLDDSKGIFENGEWRSYRSQQEITDKVLFFYEDQEFPVFENGERFTYKVKTVEPLTFDIVYDLSADDKNVLDNTQAQIVIYPSDMEPDGITYINDNLRSVSFNLRYLDSIGLVEGTHYNLVDGIKGFRLIPSAITFGTDDYIVLSGSFVVAPEDSYGDLLSRIESKQSINDKNEPNGYAGPAVEPSSFSNYTIGKYLKTNSRYHNLISSTTGAPITATEATKKVGSENLITDVDVDNVLYYKFGDGSFAVRNWINGYIDAREYCITGQDNTANLQKMLDDAPENCTFLFPAGFDYNFTDIYITKPKQNLLGQNTKITGSFHFGSDVRYNFNAFCAGFNFSNAARDSISIRNVRVLYIHNNTFTDANRAVFVGDSLDAQHVNSQIDIYGNRFSNVNYCFYVSRASTGGVKHQWQTTADCKFFGNSVNNSNVTAVYADGIDGFQMLLNVLFMPSTTSQVKQHHLRIDGQSDWVIFSDNNAFESGFASVSLENCKAFTANGNQWAWCGQRGSYPLLHFRGTITDMLLNVNGNIADGFSGDFVKIDSTCYGRGSVRDNNIFYADTFTGYYGNVDLSTIDHYVVNAQNVFNSIKVDNHYDYTIPNLREYKYVNAVFERYNRKTRFVTESEATLTKTVTAATPMQLFTIYNGGGNAQNNYSGEIIMNIRNGTGSTANIGTYKLFIGKTAAGVVKVKEISRTGLVTGAGASHPSFYFTVVDDKLVANPIGLTAGVFYFYGKADLDISIGEN